MESSSFHSQLLAVMDVLAKAAVAEINRRVDDSCAVLRLEVNRSRRDIDLLKGRCEALEAELRRSRMRARRRVLHPPAVERFPHLVKVVVNKQSQSSDWDRDVMEAEVPHQSQQCVDVEPVKEAEHLQIKDECGVEDEWRNQHMDDKLIGSGPEQPQCFESSPAQTDGFVDVYGSAENPGDPQSLSSPADNFSALPEEQLSMNQTGTELIVKSEKEEEPDENAAPLDSHVTEEGGDQLWSSGLRRDDADHSFSFGVVQHFEQSPTPFTPQSRLLLDEVIPRVHSGGKSHVVVNAARVKRRVRAFGYKRPQTDEGHGALCQINSADQSSVPPQPQHQYRDFTAPVTNPDEDLMTVNSASLPLCSRGSFGLARRMRAAWRSGIGEKRFSCTYCDKSFMRFSQLKEHLRSHTGEKPFSCLQCGRSFTKQCNLIRHAVVHSGEKPYECSLCGKCFTQRSSLKSHQKTAH